MLGWISADGENRAVSPDPENVPVLDDSLVQLDCKNCGVISAMCVLDRPDDENFMSGLINTAGVLGQGFVEVIAEKSMPATDKKTGMYYQTTVRFNNGTTRAFADKAKPAWKVGERVSVTDGVIRQRS